MQFRFVEYDEDKHENKLISYISNKNDFLDTDSPDEIFKLLFEIKKAQEEDDNIWLEVDDKGIVDSICGKGYYIKSISLIIPNIHLSEEKRILPHISVEVEEKY